MRMEACAGGWGAGGVCVWRCGGGEYEGEGIGVRG